MKLTAELVKRGGIILKEPCQTCGGIQIRYRGKDFCSSHDDLSIALKAEEVSPDLVTSTLRDLLVLKVKETTAMLKDEKEIGKQDQLVALLSKYVDLLQKTMEKR
jgi:UPF0148 protein